VPDGERLTQDALLSVRVRIHEAEWPDLEALVLYGLTSQVITWYPDEGDVTWFEVWLETPGPGEAWAPSRSGQFSRVLELDLTFRGAFGDIPWLEFFTT
jgi:hypothetical protein